MTFAQFILLAILSPILILIGITFLMLTGFLIFGALILLGRITVAIMEIFD